MKKIKVLLFLVIMIFVTYLNFKLQQPSNINLFEDGNMNLFFISEKNEALYLKQKDEINNKDFENILFGNENAKEIPDFLDCSFCHKNISGINFILTEEQSFSMPQIKELNLMRPVLIIKEDLNGAGESWATLLDLEYFEYVFILTNKKGVLDKKNLVYINNASPLLLQYIKLYKRDNQLYVAKEKIKSKTITESNWKKVKNVIPIYEIKFDEDKFYKQWEKLPKRKTTETNWIFWNSNNDKFNPVKAKIKMDDDWQNAKLKIRGDVDNHWVNVKKSFNIKLKDTQGGRETLKFIMAEDRGVLYQYLYETAISNGSMHPKTELVWLIANDKDLGAYYLFEDLDKPFLETRGFSGDSFIYKNEWEDQEFGRMIKVFDDINLFSKSAVNKTSEIEKTEIEILYEAIKSKNLSALKNIIDIESFENWYVNILYWGDNHQNDYDNLRLIYDPTAGRFVFISWDPVFRKIKEDEPLLRSASPISDILIKDPKIKQDILSKLKFRVYDEKNIEKEKKFITNLYSEVIPIFLADPHNGVLGVSDNSGLKILEENISKLKKLINNTP